MITRPSAVDTDVETETLLGVSQIFALLGKQLVFYSSFLASDLNIEDLENKIFLDVNKVFQLAA